MLVLSRQRDEKVVIDGLIWVTIVDIRGDKVRLGIDAPSELPVHREEVFNAIERCHGAQVGFLQRLLDENAKLRSENKELKARLPLTSQA